MDNSISSAKLADITVDVAAVIRKHGITCQFNEDLNVLQSALANQFINGWTSIEVRPQYGAFDYWEAAHKRVGITRPTRKIV